MDDRRNALLTRWFLTGALIVFFLLYLAHNRGIDRTIFTDELQIYTTIFLGGCLTLIGHLLWEKKTHAKRD